MGRRRPERALPETPIYVHVTTRAHGQQSASYIDPPHTAMRLKRHVPLLKSTLKHVAARPLVSSLFARTRCRYASSSTAYPENIAVLGGGVSGLASAYFVSQSFPDSKITIYEAEKETGGWIKSRRVDVPGGNVLFEYGPRTLRPGAACLPTAQLVHLTPFQLHPPLMRHRSKSSILYRTLYTPNALLLAPRTASSTIPTASTDCRPLPGPLHFPKSLTLREVAY